MVPTGVEPGPERRKPPEIKGEVTLKSCPPFVHGAEDAIESLEREGLLFRRLPDPGLVEQWSAPD